MSEVVKVFKDGEILEFSRGKFDDNCIYLIDVGGRKKAPKDMEIFSYLVELSKENKKEDLYSSFVKIYDETQNDVKKKF